MSWRKETHAVDNDGPYARLTLEQSHQVWNTAQELPEEFGDVNPTPWWIHFLQASTGATVSFVPNLLYLLFLICILRI